MVHSLVLIAYERVRQIFSIAHEKVPSTAFIDELYDEAPLAKLQQYVVGHTDYWIRNGDLDDWKEWQAVLERKAQFGVAVAVQFANHYSDLYQGHKQHPIKDHALYADEIFPQPKSVIKTETVTGQETGHGVD